MEKEEELVGLVVREVVENGRKVEEEGDGKEGETTVGEERVGYNKAKKSELIICVWFGITDLLALSLPLSLLLLPSFILLYL